MKKLILSFVLSLLSLNAFSTDFFSDNKKGFWITPKAIPQNQIALKNEDEFVFEGEICVVKWGGATKDSDHGNNGKGKDKDKDKGKDNDDKNCLKVPESKLSFKAHFPDSLHDATDRLIIKQSADKKSWSYVFKTDKLKSSDLNQFTLTIGSGDKKIQELLSIKAKLEKRILILNDFKVLYQGNDRYKENLAYINKLVVYLESLITKINLSLETNPEIIAQLRQPLQVENKTSAPFYYSSNFSGYKLSLKIPTGVMFEGEKATLEASVTNISNKSFYFPEVVDEDYAEDTDPKPDGNQSFRLSVIQDGQALVTTTPFKLGFGETKTISVKTGVLSLTAANKIKTLLERSSSGKFENYSLFNRTLGTLFADMHSIEDSVAPTFTNIKPASDLYVRVQPSFEATLVDSLGRINPVVFTKKLPHFSVQLI